MRELPSRFRSTWFTFRRSHTTSACRTPEVSMERLSPLLAASCCSMEYRSSKTVVRLQQLSSSVTLPCSMRLMSRMSFIRFSRWSLDALIFSR